MEEGKEDGKGEENKIRGSKKERRTGKEIQRGNQEESKEKSSRFR